MPEALVTRLLIENLATIVAITGILGFVALGPIGRALARRIEGRGIEAEDLERRLGQLDLQSRRLQELEERLDFAERLLAQRREVERFPGSAGAS